MSRNPEVQTTLDDAVSEVLGLLTGLDLTYQPELDRYRAITRQLNRALRANALENEWSWYFQKLSVGKAVEGEREMTLPIRVRPRITNDDAVQLVDADEHVLRWAYYLPRDAIHKYESRRGLWVSVVRQSLIFSRGFSEAEAGLDVRCPVMREPIMFRLPERGETVSRSIRNQPIDFSYPDVVVARAAWYYAQADPVMQPRAQTLEEQYKDLMYQLIERDTQHTDSAYINDYVLPVDNGLRTVSGPHWHPHA